MVAHSERALGPGCPALHWKADGKFLNRRMTGRPPLIGMWLFAEFPHSGNAGGLNGATGRGRFVLGSAASGSFDGCKHNLS
jgi:hypothetical protein